MVATRSSTNTRSSKANPCPVCGRAKDGDCETRFDGLVFCHRGATHHPPEGIKPGEVHNGYAFLGDTELGKAMFKPDEGKCKPKPHPRVVPSPSRPLLARLPDGANVPDLNREKATYRYGPKQEVRRAPDGKGGKTVKPWHLQGRQWGCGGGSDPWPLYQQDLALQADGWLLEVEGERCVGIAMAAGLVAISQPGHNHTPDAITARYAALVDACKKVFYVADNDAEGIKKAARLRDCAAAAGLQFISVNAADVWPAIPEKGSIDDAPGRPAEQVAALEAALLRAQTQAPASNGRLLTMAEVGDRLREAISEGIGGADLAALVAEMDAASGQGSFNVQRLADAIRTEQLQAVAVEAEGHQIAAERDRQEIGEMLSAHYLLPASIAAAIEARSRYLPCAGPSAVLPFLATVAGLVKLGTEVEGCAVAGYRVPVNLFACLVGRSGAKKSPIGRLLVEAPTAGLRADLARANQREREAWEQECREMKKSETKPPAPNPKRLSVSDFTGEALAAQLQTQEAAGLGLLVNRDELSGLFASLNQYKGGRGADEQQLLELFDGSGLSSLRIVGDRHYSRSQLSIWGSTQTDSLRKLVADGDASGLWARFLFVPLPERAIPLPMSTSAAEVAVVEAAAQTLANACSAVYRLPRQTYRLAPAAAERFAHYELNRQRAALGATIGAQSALYGKSAGKVLRVAGVLHLLQITAGEISSGAAIEQATIDKAAALVDHLDAWALGLHAEVAAGGVGQLMRTVHRVAEAVASPIRWKELAVRLSAKARREIDAAAFAEAAQALAAAGYGEVETGKRGAVSYQSTRALP
jgi:hypothetical protein